MRVLLISGAAALAVVAVFACSSSDDATQSPATEAGADAPTGDSPAESSAPGSMLQHGGTRIKLQGTLTAEGAFVFDGLYDTKLDTPCYPYPTADGIDHCIPAARAYIGYFADDQCTSAVAITAKGACDNPKFGVRT